MAIAKLHPDDSVLQAFLDDELEAVQATNVADHLGDCEQCQVNMDRLCGATSSRLTETLRNLKTIDKLQRLALIRRQNPRTARSCIPGRQKIPVVE